MIMLFENQDIFIFFFFCSRGAPRYGAKSDRFERTEERPAARFEAPRRGDPRPGRHERFAFTSFVLVYTFVIVSL